MKPFTRAWYADVLISLLFLALFYSLVVPVYFVVTTAHEASK